MKQLKTIVMQIIKKGFDVFRLKIFWYHVLIFLTGRRGLKMTPLWINYKSKLKITNKSKLEVINRKSGDEAIKSDENINRKSDNICCTF